MSQLTIDTLVKRYQDGTNNEIVAVDELNIDLGEGEFLVLVRI